MNVYKHAVTPLQMPLQPQTAPFPPHGVPLPMQSVPFPAELLDRAMPHLTDTEWRLLCVIVRQTLGWRDAATGGRKERDWLTQAQLAGRAGRSRRAVSGAVEGLVRKGFIRVQTEAGELLETPEARRGYGGRHWFLLRPEPADEQPPSISNLNTLNGSTTNGSTTRSIAETSQGAPIIEAANSRLTDSRLTETSQGAAKNARRSAESAGKYLPTTKESPDKRKSFSEREPLKGSLSEKALWSERTAYASATHEKSSYGESPRVASEGPQPESAYEAESSAAERSYEDESGAEKEPLGNKLTQAQAPSMPTTARAEGMLAEPGYLRQLVQELSQDETADVAEVGRFLLNYQDACRKLFPGSEAASLAWCREGKIVADLLRHHPYERLLRLLNRFLTQTEARPDPRHHPRQAEHGYDLAAFAQAIPGMVAQGRQEVAQGVRRPAAAFPIKIWREDEILKIDGPTSSMLGDEGRRPAGATADIPGRRWHWAKGTQRWVASDRPEGGRTEDNGADEKP